MKRTSHAMSTLLILMFLLFCSDSLLAKGLKGNLEANELDFIDNTLIPILIKSNLCVKAKGDCKVDHIFCLSNDSLACDVYGISDKKVIMEIFTAMLNSGLDVSSFKFWKNKFHKTSSFEKPLLEYKNRTGGK